MQARRPEEAVPFWVTQTQENLKRCRAELKQMKAEKERLVLFVYAVHDHWPHVHVHVYAFASHSVWNGSSF